MSTFVLILRVLTTATAILVSIAPLPDFWHIHKNRATGEVSILPVVTLLANCYMWVLYAYLVNNIFPLFAVTLFGIATSTVFICIYYRWTKDRLYVVKVCGIALTLLAVGTLYYILATNDVTNQSEAAVEKTLGFIAIAFDLVLYASPLETMKTVVQTKNASSLPISISATFLLNAVLWVVFAVAVSDMFVLVPNAIGTFLCSIQVVLYIIYRPGRIDVPKSSVDAVKENHPIERDIAIHVDKNVEYEGLSSPMSIALLPKRAAYSRYYLIKVVCKALFCFLKRGRFVN
ncbi:Sugar efflux transporter for intercellular exchange [Phytophthora infestans]|uniref:Sugar transporter SWEET1 n=1 Tax=Phytophthora infestans TaxID=4787 RepID=A0A833RRJ0_PHYIN|nr:Sugar efflux transporter for intercellular exchange [Phytophthora infestans]KAF4031452.1 Sugar efflux transporter for intercellular exchange [Phytophthora infestans]KAF4135112.1 Sugar efflux transporter for intercellular exchange [Phytophthora infestans]